MAEAGGMARSNIPSIRIAGFSFNAGAPAAPAFTNSRMRPSARSSGKAIAPTQSAGAGKGAP